MIYHVLTYDEYGHPLDYARVGAWNLAHAEDIITGKLKSKFGIHAVDKTFRLIHQNHLLLFVPLEEVEAAREEFLDTVARF